LLATWAAILSIGINDLKSWSQVLNYWKTA